MPNSVVSFEHFILGLTSIPRRCATLLLGIDGCGASGKSTFSQTLKTLAPKVTVVQMDDFFLPSKLRLPRETAVQRIGADFDWPRVGCQVLEPLQRNEPGNYQRYDWDSDSLAEWHTVPVGGIVIVEGIYSTRSELSGFYDVTVWVDCPRHLRLSRGLKRDGEQARNLWEKDWMPAEDRYAESHRPHEAADMVVDGSIAPDRDTPRFVCVRAGRELLGEVSA